MQNDAKAAARHTRKKGAAPHGSCRTGLIPLLDDLSTKFGGVCAGTKQSPLCQSEDFALF